MKQYIRSHIQTVSRNSLRNSFNVSQEQIPATNLLLGEIQRANSWSHPRENSLFYDSTLCIFFSFIHLWNWSDLKLKMPTILFKGKSQANFDQFKFLSVWVLFFKIRSFLINKTDFHVLWKVVDTTCPQKDKTLLLNTRSTFILFSFSKHVDRLLNLLLVFLTRLYFSDAYYNFTFFFNSGKFL